MSLHLKRVESNPHFPVAEFLCLFQRHTMKQVRKHLPTLVPVGTPRVQLLSPHTAPLFCIHDCAVVVMCAGDGLA